MAIEGLNSGSVNTADFDGSAKAGNGRPISPFNHSQLGGGKALVNPSLFINASDIQDALEGGANLKKLMATSKKSEDSGDDFLDTLSKKLEALKKAQEVGQSTLNPEQLASFLKEFQSLHEKGELNEGAIKEALGGMSGQDQYEALGLIIDTLRETNSEELASVLANTPVIDHNAQTATFSEMRNGLQGSMSRVADFKTLAEAMSYINEEMKAAGGFYETVISGIDWLRAGLVVEMAMFEKVGQMSSSSVSGQPSAQLAEKLYLSGDTEKARTVINQIYDKNELLLLQEKVKQIPANTPHLATVKTVINERLVLFKNNAVEVPAGKQPGQVKT